MIFASLFCFIIISSVQHDVKYGVSVFSVAISHEFESFQSEKLDEILSSSGADLDNTEPYGGKLTREDARDLGKKAFDSANGNSVFFILHACYDVLHLNDNDKTIKTFQKLNFS